MNRRSKIRKKFDDITEKINSKWSFFSTKFSINLQKVENLENQREKIFVNCLKQYTTKLSEKSVEIMRVQELNVPTSAGFLDEVLPCLPLDWTNQEIKENDYQQTVAELERSRSTALHDR